MNEQCQAKDCQEPALFECQWCHKRFCLLHIIDENEDGRHGDEPALGCMDCVPFNEFGTIDSKD